MYIAQAIIIYLFPLGLHLVSRGNNETKLQATLRWFTAGGAMRIAVRKISQTWKLHHYDVIDDVVSRKL